MKTFAEYAKKMATKISDEELRNRLLPLYGSIDQIPPIVDATRSLLISKLSKNNGVEVVSNSIPVLIACPKEAKDFKTLVFFDLEATGLPSDTCPPRITEIHFKALGTEHFLVLNNALELYK